MNPSRAIVRLLASALVGMGCTVGVAWALAATARSSRGAYVYGSFKRADDHLISLHRWCTFGCVFVETEPDSYSGWSPLRRDATAVVSLAEARPYWLPNSALPWLESEAWDNTKHPAYVGVDGFGWPMVALFCEHHRAAWAGPADSQYLIHLPYLDSRHIGARQQFPAGLPLRPAFPGFIMDALLFGAGFLLLSGVARMGLRSVRRRRGRCSKCGYDCRGIPIGSPCPECGRVANGLSGVEGGGKRGLPAF